MPQLFLRIDFGPDARIGPGKIALLEAIGREGSISGAGRALGMSYRRAWLLVEAINRLFAEPVVATQLGGARGGGARLTGLGRELVASYRTIEADAGRAAAERVAAIGRRLRAAPPEG